MSHTEKTPIRNYLEWSHEGNSAIWRYVLAVVLGFLAFMLGSMASVLIFDPFNINILDDPVAFYYTFIVGLVAVPLLVRFLLGRPAYSVALPSWPPHLRDYGLAILIQWMAMAIAYIALVDVSYRGFENLSSGVLLRLILALVGIFITTTFEEMFFRGLMIQATYRVIKWLPVAFGVQAYFFAQLHLGNMESSEPIIWKWLLYLIPALTLAWVAWRSGSLVLPMGLHFANNVFVQLFIGTQGDIEGIAPFLATPPVDSPIFHMVVTTVLQYLIVIIVIEVIIRWRAVHRSG